MQCDKRATHKKKTQADELVNEWGDLDGIEIECVCVVVLGGRLRDFILILVTLQCSLYFKSGT